MVLIFSTTVHTPGFVLLMNFTNSHKRIVNATLCLSNLRYMYEISDKPLMLCRVHSSAAMAKWSCVQVTCINLLIGAGASANTRVFPFEERKIGVREWWCTCTHSTLFSHLCLQSFRNVSSTGTSLCSVIYRIILQRILYTLF